MNFSTLLRLASITAGIVSVTILAWKGFDFRFDPFFLSVLQLIENFVGEVVRPIELLVIEPLFTWLREFGWNLELLPHWKHAFILMWLLFATQARAHSTPEFWWPFPAFLWLWGGICALSAAALAGSVPLTHSNATAWPLAGCGLYLTGRIAWEATFAPRASAFVSFLRLATILLTVFMILGASGQQLMLAEGRHDPSGDTTDRLILLPALITSVIYYLIVAGVLTRDQHRLRAGLDILAVIGGASAIVAINQLLV